MKLGVALVVLGSLAGLTALATLPWMLRGSPSEVITDILFRFVALSVVPLYIGLKRCRKAR